MARVLCGMFVRWQAVRNEAPHSNTECAAEMSQTSMARHLEKESVGGGGVTRKRGEPSFAHMLKLRYAERVSNKYLLEP